MAKKELMNAESHWDGNLLSLIGISLLEILVFGVFLVAGILSICWNIVGAGKDPLYDLQQPLTIALVLLGLVLIGVGFCWACIIFMKWETKHTVVSGYRMSLQANTWNLFWNCVKWTLLTIITVGIYSLWMPIKVTKWRVAHTVSVPEVEEEEEVVEEEEEVVDPTIPKIIFKEYDDESELGF